MNTLWTIVILLKVTFVLSQAPEGKLFLLSSTGPQSGILGYIDYPGSVYVHIDSIGGEDVLVGGGQLFVASGQGGVSINAPIYRYTTRNFKRVDSTVGVGANRIVAWQNHIVALCHTRPYFRVFETGQGMPVAFSLDTTKIPYTPMDVVVRGDRAYVLLSGSIMVVDLVNQDTVASVIIPVPLWPGAGGNRYLSSVGEQMYIYIDYFTAVPRAAMIRFDPESYATDSLFLAELQYALFRPVVADSLIYLFHFDSHYAVDSDTLVLHTFGQDFAVEFDPLSKSVFIRDSAGISIVNDSLVAPSVPVPGFLRAAFFASEAMLNRTDPLHRPAGIFAVFPNPAVVRFRIRTATPVHIQEIKLLDAAGRLVLREVVEKKATEWQVGTADLAQGVYFLQIMGKDWQVGKRMLIH